MKFSIYRQKIFFICPCIWPCVAVVLAKKKRTKVQIVTHVLDVSLYRHHYLLFSNRMLDTWKGCSTNIVGSQNSTSYMSLYSYGDPNVDSCRAIRNLSHSIFL